MNDKDSIRLRCLDIASKHVSDNTAAPFNQMMGGSSHRTPATPDMILGFATKLYEFFEVPKKTKRK